MNEENTPFLNPRNSLISLKKDNAAIISFSSLIIIFSIINFFLSSSDFLIIHRANLLFIFPFVTNIFTETEIPMFVINSILAFVLMMQLLKYWTIKNIIMFACPVAIACNAFIGIVASVFSQNASMNGSLSLIVALCCALCYGSHGEIQKLMNRISLYPTDIVWIILIWVLLCLRWPPLVALSGFLCVPCSYFALLNFHNYLGLPRNEDFTWRSIIDQPTFKEDAQKQEPASLLDTIEIDSGQTLSEADQNRRLRALRAIEERLASATV